jgi:hypothetical protein
MMRTIFTAFIMLLIGGAAFSQTVDQSVNELEKCFELARLGDKTCEGYSDAQQHLDCLKKTRDEHLECLARVLPSERTNSTRPPDVPPPGTAKESMEGGAVDRAGPSEPTKNSRLTPSSPNGDADLGQSKTSPLDGTATTARQSDSPAAAETGSAPATDHWIVSETTSPVDFSALVTAVVQAAEPGDKGPSDLTIRCRAKRTELSLQFGTAIASKSHRPGIYFQIGDQSATKQVWNWSADGKTATFKDDVVSLLQSLPNSTRITIWTDDSDARRGTGFQLGGIDALRRKIAAACNWTPQQSRTSPKKK